MIFERRKKLFVIFNSYLGSYMFHRADLLWYDCALWFRLQPRNFQSIIIQIKYHQM